MIDILDDGVCNEATSISYVYHYGVFVELELEFFLQRFGKLHLISSKKTFDEKMFIFTSKNCLEQEGRKKGDLNYICRAPLEMTLLNF